MSDTEELGLLFDLAKNIGIIEAKMDAKDTEIERLRERIKNLGTDLDRKIVTITRQRQRIEEMEKAVRYNAFNDDGECLVCGSGGEDECFTPAAPWLAEKRMGTKKNSTPAAAEIERLRERVDQVEAQRDAVAETLSDDNEQLQKRIEELEKKLRTPVQCPQCDLNMGAYSTAVRAVHHITDEQINRAWGEAFSFGAMSRGAINALAELNIVRCEGCYSCMEKDSTAARKRLDCGGHGWVVLKPAK